MRTPFRSLVSALVLFVSLSLVSVKAETPKARLNGQIGGANVAIAGTRPPLVALATDAGKVDPATRIEGMTIVFARTPAQEDAIQTLIAAQQNSSSPLYHQWLTPQQFGSQFGLADADLNKITTWLQSQGFSIDRIANSRDRVSFTGTAGQFAATFGSEIHHFQLNGEVHFAPATDLSFPASLAGIVTTVGNVSDFRPRSHVKLKTPQANPQFTSASSGNHFLTPGDVSTIYDVNAAYSAGYNGTGISIAVIGQSGVVSSDITTFQTNAGVPVRAPTYVLEPFTGSSAISSGDEGESDLDLEYTSGMAKGAAISFVYTGNSGNYNAFDALEYAIQNKTAQIISVSYGACETAVGASAFASINAVFAQAATQGQTIVAASGDDGSTDCYEFTTLSTSVRQSLAVDFPSDSQYVTGLGGSEFTNAAVASGTNQYWITPNGSDVISSAKSYMPEQVWNDDALEGALASGGGGYSTLVTRPTWQAGVFGIPSGTTRLVPDISLAASPNNAGYLYCSSDSSSTGINGSCSNGFRDVNNQYLTVAGGTSFAAPVFAGMLAVISQKLGSTGLGVINPTLYTLASSATTYATVFHDVSAGGNQCLVTGSTVCSSTGAGSYAAGIGYDVASGIGSVDLYNLLTAWPTSTTPTLSATTTTVTLTPSSIAVGGTSTFGVTVAASTGTGTPSGTVQFLVNGTNYGTAVTLSGGSASLPSAAFPTAGSYQVTAVYSGDTLDTTSTSTAQTLTVTALPIPTVTLAITPTTIVVGGTDSFTATVSSTTTPGGTVQFQSNGVNVGSAVTLVSGVATLNPTPAFTSAGTFQITAVYSGSTTYATATSAASTLTVNTGLFTLTNSGPISLTAGATTGNSSTITVVAGTGFSGSVALSCSIATSAAIAPGCALSASSAVAGGTSVLTISTVAPHTAKPTGTSAAWRGISAATLAGLLLFGLPLARRRKNWTKALAMAICALAFAGISGCGGSSTPPAVKGGGTTTGTYFVTVTGTSTADGTATTSVTLTVN